MHTPLKPLSVALKRSQRFFEMSGGPDESQPPAENDMAAAKPRQPKPPTASRAPSGKELVGPTRTRSTDSGSAVEPAASSIIRTSSCPRPGSRH